MKKIRRVVAVILSMIMVLSSMTNVFAAGKTFKTISFDIKTTDGSDYEIIGVWRVLADNAYEDLYEQGSSGKYIRYNKKSFDSEMVFGIQVKLSNGEYVTKTLRYNDGKLSGQNLSFKLTFEVKPQAKPEYTVTYTDDATLDTVKIEEGTIFTVEKNMEKNGFKFLGWSDGEKTYEVGQSFEVKKDVALTAVWEQIFYTVTYKVGENVVKVFNDLKYDDDVPTFEYTPADNEVFSGWGYIPEKVTDNIEIYGSVDTKTYMVQFVDDDGRVISRQAVVHGEKAIVPGSPAKADVKVENGTDAAKWSKFTFAGWAAEGDYDVDDAVTQEMTFKATYTESTVKVYYYILNRGMAQPNEPASHDSKDYSKNGVEGSLKSFTAVANNDEKVKEVIYNAPEASDFGITLNDGEYIKWYVVKSINADKWHVDGIIVGQQYNVTVEYIDADTNETIMENTVTPVAATEEYDIELPQIEGYELVDSSTVVSGVMPYDNVKATVKYQKTEHTVTYKVNGVTVDEFTVKYGEDVPASTYVVSEGYDFTGFELVTVVEDASVVKQDMVFEATQTIKTFTVIYYLNGEVYFETVAEYGDVKELLGSPAGESENFSGWTVSGDLSNIIDNIEIVGSTTIKTFVVTYIVDGEVVDEITVEYGEEVPASTYEAPEGYEFTGFELVTVVEDAEAVKQAMTFVGSTAKKTFVVTYKVDGEVVDEITVEYGEEVPASTYEVPEGYEFTGFELVTVVEDASVVKHAMTFEGTTSLIVVEEEEEEDVEIDTPFAPGTTEEDDNTTEDDSVVEEDNATEDDSDETVVEDTNNDTEEETVVDTDDSTTSDNEEEDIDLDTPFAPGVTEDDNDEAAVEEEEDIDLDTPFDSGVQTGDASNYSLYVAVLLIAAVGAMVVAYNRKRALN